MSLKCWGTVCDADPTVNQHLVSVPGLLGYHSCAVAWNKVVVHSAVLCENPNFFLASQSIAMDLVDTTSNHAAELYLKINRHHVGIQVWKDLNSKKYTIIIQIFTGIYVVSLEILWRCSRRARSCWQFLNDVFVESLVLKSKECGGSVPIACIVIWRGVYAQNRAKSV